MRPIIRPRWHGVSVMQRTLLITVQGQWRAVDVELPGDALTGELLPLLLEMCSDPALPPAHGKRAAVSWSLSVAGTGKPLATAFTLLDNNILDGDILLLQERGLLPAPDTQVKQGIPESIPPSERSGGIGVTWERL
jgi:WXG100 protein secretion system (Wss), protein YukD